ncbi:MAG: ribosome small subunit-dependent GTPase A [Thermomonas sp.]|jgi:ribosome biogenesis GTPase|uniref:ribosome small subunit-dependent GTPase A n=1 Tax=Thermomonas sp. TaxID=1971895 RepID=UPI0026005730|nr:ribosome small subunit-dependent GTPase A [Thermomonas sp.]MBK6926008.1 ribosome small subunit-dependent GTPase A [Thermomonas sp.]MBK9669339.1 ribosome small subunit-dependent GTPase A [Thermomonas sp.]HQY83103.1 ribosome small subunit-dependent GTPase A [Thermomonas sp.]
MTPLQAIGWRWTQASLDPAWAELMAAHPQARQARISEQHRSGYLVAESVDASHRAESLPEWQRGGSYRRGEITPESRPAVGDWVLVEGEAPNALRIVALLPRFSAIKRGAAGEHYKQQVIAANIDTVFVVCGLDADFNPRRIERYLLLVGGSGVQPVVVLTKSDKEGADVEAALQELLALGVPVLAVNAKDRASVAGLEPWLGEGQSIVLVGSSGAGKSTLTNTLLGLEKMKTGAVRAGDDRGRHTTTHRALIALPSGACMIDTPGMRELKPTGEEVVAESFADIEALAASCKFNDCRHQQEPGCAVREAIASGAADARRVASFFKLSSEVAGAANKLATRLAQKADAKVGNKAFYKRVDDKYGRH